MPLRVGLTVVGHDGTNLLLFSMFQVWGKQALPGQLQELLTDRCEKSCCFEITRFQLQKTVFISNNKNRNSFAFARLVYISFFSLLLSACYYYLS